VQQQVLPPRIIEVDTLFIGGGPATLGVLANAYQTQRLEDLVLGRSASKNQGKPNANINDQKSNNLNAKSGNHSFSMSLNQMVSDSMVQNGAQKGSTNLNSTFNGTMPTNNNAGA
jgi:hypothetical protein